MGSQSKLGPYVVIGAGVKIGDNVRIKNSVIQAGVEIKVYNILKVLRVSPILQIL